jgi:cyclopropane-fatty-acyl-phospholipid synthase
MARQAQIEETYNYMDELFRLCYGEHGDCSGAMFDLDFSKSLGEAQDAKHEYILSNLRIEAGKRLLDVGCGWGPILSAARKKGAHAVGLTLSTKQAEACRRNGLEVYVKDWRDVRVDTFGKFTAVTSVGSFEHFCSEEEFLEGKQETIYAQFFKLCSDLLSSGERLFLQTMLWAKSAPHQQDISLRAQRGSNEYIVAVLKKFYPGSWLPLSEEQIIQCAKPYFEVVSLKNGRLDYIETMGRWNIMRDFSVAKLLALVKTSRYFFADRNFRYKVQSLLFSYNRECFKRGIMDHQRIVFHKL